MSGIYAYSYSALVTLQPGLTKISSPEVLGLSGSLSADGTITVNSVLEDNFGIGVDLSNSSMIDLSGQFSYSRPGDASTSPELPQLYGVNLYGGNSSLNNTGSIIGAADVIATLTIVSNPNQSLSKTEEIGADGVGGTGMHITNGVSGFIGGTRFGVYTTGTAASTILNYGTIQGMEQPAYEQTTTDILNGSASAYTTIVNGTMGDGVFLGSKGGDGINILTNNGLVAGAVGVNFGSLQSYLYNYSKGTIVGVYAGVLQAAATTPTPIYVYNSGLIAGAGTAGSYASVGVQFDAGDVINAAAGTIAGGVLQIASNAPAQISNAGLLVNGTGAGADLLDGVILNSGTIAGAGSVGVGVSLTEGYLYNSKAGVIGGAAAGVVLGGPLLGSRPLLVNFGSIESNTGYGVRTAGGVAYNYGLITGASAGLLSTGSMAVYNYSGDIASGNGVHDGVDDAGVQAAAGYVYNAGTVQGADGIVLRSMSNGDSGSIDLVVNYGIVIGSKNAAVVMGNGGLVENYGSLTGAAYGIDLTGPGAVYNSGKIAGSSKSGVFVNEGAVYNYHGAAISGEDGVDLTGGAALFNYGVVTGTLSGVGEDGLGGGGVPGNIYNYKGAKISGKFGVYLSSGGLLLNKGKITGSVAGVGIYAGGGTVNNSGVIRGGLRVSYGATVIDQGTIGANSSGTALVFDAGPNDAYAGLNHLVINAAAQIRGTVSLGLGSLEIEKDDKKTTTIGTNFVDIGTLTVDSGAILETSGYFSLDSTVSVVNQGTIKLGAHDQLTIAGPVSGNGTFELSRSSGLTLGGTVGAAQNIAFSGTGETLVVGLAGGFLGTVEGFSIGDTIELASVSLESIESLSFGGGVLTVEEANGSQAIKLADPTNFGSDSFSAFADGSGIGITLSAPPQMTYVTPSPSSILSTASLSELDMGYTVAANMLTGSGTAPVTLSSNFGSLVDLWSRPTTPAFLPVTLHG
jgi:hypothetical protein